MLINPKQNSTANHLFVCNCGELEHQFVVSYFDDDEDFVYIHVHLNQLSWSDRLRAGLAYIFGKRSRFGAFGEILLDQNQCARLAHILEHRSRGVIPDVQ
jgi:hypothetical protein